MELTLYNRLKRKLLGDLAEASERHDPAWQKSVEAYASTAETGVAKWGRDTIQDWVARYNRLVSRPVQLRYYQILALYFTEAFLREQRDGKRQTDAERRNKLAYWMATGSGKTLLMHINILQYIDHIGGLQAFDELQVIVTTPGVNLIEQHRREIAPIIDALNRQCAGRVKLRVESTGSLLNFEKGYFTLPSSTRTFRLVLVDEGHIGLAGGGKEMGAFKQLRRDLADYDNAFLFEYSATYHGIADRHVTEYGEQIVFDYNYYRFYRDGYGKDYAIHRVGLDRVVAGKEAWDNFRAAFDTLVDKLRTHDELRLRDSSALGFVSAFADKPLIAFMGNTVEDRKDEGKEGKDEVSDIRKLLAYLAKLTRADREALSPVFNGQIEGPLRLTRCPAVPDEIWLSWGEGQFWGIVNVGNGEKFHSDCEGHPELTDNDEPLVQVRKADIVEPRFLFGEIDRPASPINVLIGSRKFAEGWNCFRVSVIGLINLGSSRGNKIIQIFGRGVRLRGTKGDGKRRNIEHIADYDALLGDDTPQTRLRRLETLNIFSLKASYLETFLAALDKELDNHLVVRRVNVVTQSLKLGRSIETFEAYSSRLPIFKVGREESEPRLIATKRSERWEWSYLDGEESREGTLAKWAIELDYRPSPDQPSVNLARDLEYAVKEGSARAAFAAVGDHAYRLANLLDRRKLQLLINDGVRSKTMQPADLLALVGTANYHRRWQELDFATQEGLVWQVMSEAVAKLHHRLIYDINKRLYRIAEPLKQTQLGQPGDFISHYDVRLAFETEATMSEFKRQFPSPNLPAQLELVLDGTRHIYRPLYRDGRDQSVAKLKFKNISIAPDALNSGERKFVEDLHSFLSDPAWQARLKGFDFYLMRNVESLRSVGVYLDTESRAYFPDFVLWAVSDKKTHILLIDPKGQTGIMNWDTLAVGTNAKVDLAKSAELSELGQKLFSATGIPCAVSSFILLRKSSPLGKATGSGHDASRVAEMEERHLLRLDWAPKINGQRIDEDGDRAAEPPEGRCYLERMLTLAGIMTAYN